MRAKLPPHPSPRYLSTPADAPVRPPDAVPEYPVPSEVVTPAAALRLHEAVMAAVAQELSTPLMVVWSYTDVLRRLATSLAAPQSGCMLEALAHVQTALRQVAALNGALQDATRLPLGQPPRPRQTDLAALARARVAAWQTTTAQHQLRVGRAPGRLVGWWDPAQLAQVLNALLSNAVAYSPEGGAITVSLARVPTATGPWARLSVADPGVGIPAEELAVLGARVHRGAAVAAWTPGAGLGLVLARHLLEQQGGRLLFASERGVGTTATVLLPLQGRVEGSRDACRA